MLSCSAFGTPGKFSKPSYPVRIDIVGREKPEGQTDHPEVTFHGKIKDTFPLLSRADVAVVNGGFSAISEMVWMNKPLVVVPVPNHAEQWINARTIMHLGLGLIATQENYEEVMLKAFNKIEEFRSSYKKLPALSDGAAEASVAIIDLASRKR